VAPYTLYLKGRYQKFSARLAVKIIRNRPQQRSLVNPYCKQRWVKNWHEF